jgi:hypothetical protein
MFCSCLGNSLITRLLLWEMSGKSLGNSSENSGNIWEISSYKRHENRVKPCQNNRRQTLIVKSLPPNYLIIKLFAQSSIAACAAATRAMGTRNGEQDT